MKKKRIVIIAVIAVLFMLSGIVTVAKYVQTKSLLNVAAPGHIYISSDQMSKDGKEIPCVWDGKSLSIPVSIYSSEGLHKSNREVNLNYEIECESSSIQAVIEGAENTINADEEQPESTFYIKVKAAEGAVIANNDTIPVTVTVTEKMYNQQLSATWMLKIQRQVSTYKISDQGAYLSCEIQIPAGSSDEQNVGVQWNPAEFAIDSTNPLVYKNTGMEDGNMELKLKTGASCEIYFYKIKTEQSYSEKEGELELRNGKYVMEVNP